MSARSLFCSLLLLTSVRSVQAQEEDVYTREWGIGGGTMTLLSDTNAKLFGQSGMGTVATLRFVLSPRAAMATQLTYAQVKGQSSPSYNFYPYTVPQSISHGMGLAYHTHLFALSGQYELHFFPYGYRRGYDNHRRWTPFLQIGAGFAYSTAGQAFTMAFPLGVGVKYKIAPRLNFVLDWRMNFTASDKLDGFDSPTTIKSDLMRNKDHYGQLLLTLTYDFMPVCPTCNKAD